MAETPIRLLILGAHPDDAEYHAAGLASVYREGGHSVRMISMTDGSAGHHRLLRDEVAAMRRKEAAASAAVIGATCQVWDFSDGELEPTLELRRRVIAEIRNYRPDLVLTHRTNDYHPDHRAAGQVVQDAAFLVRVPHVVPEVPALPSDPIIGCMADLFTRPCPMSTDIVLDITPRIDTIVEMLRCRQTRRAGSAGSATGMSRRSDAARSIAARGSWRLTVPIAAAASSWPRCSRSVNMAER